MLSDKRIREIDYWAGTYWSYSWKAAWAVLSVFLMVPIFWFFWGGIPVAAWATLGFYVIPACIGLCIHRLLYRRRMRVIHGL
jgi:hypothetical protein